MAGALGDFILALPALSVLRRAFPSSRIDLVGNPGWLSLALQSGHVDTAHSLEDLSLYAAFQESFSKDHPLCRFLQAHDLIVSWFGDREGRWEESVRSVCPGKVFVQPFHEYLSFQGHVSDYYLDILYGIGVKAEAFQKTPLWPTSLLWAPDPSAAHPDEGKVPQGLCIHSGSGSRKKNWPKEDFLEVALAAHRHWNLPVVVLLGEAEKGQQEFWEQKSGPWFLVQSCLPLPEVSRILSRSTLYVGNDSGITHLSASLGVPTVALFGPTDPARFAPRGPLVRVLFKKPSCSPQPIPPCAKSGQGSGLEQISPEEVFHALQGFLPR